MTVVAIVVAVKDVTAAAEKLGVGTDSGENGSGLSPHATASNVPNNRVID
jgi:hypothetical protein